MKKLLALFVLLTWGHLALCQSDNCATATVLAECTLTNATNTGATTGADDNYTASAICATSIDNSVWYSFTPAQTGPYTILLSNFACTGSTQLELGIFSGTCGSLSSINCEQNNAGINTAFNAVAGQTYFIVIDGVAGSGCGFDITVCPGCNAGTGFTMDVSTGIYPLTVNFSSTGPAGNVYTWDFGDGGATFDGSTASFTYDEPGTFIITLTAFNGVCYNSFSDTLSVTGSSSLLIPNVFTPNDDEQNDLFRIRCSGIKSLDVEIYNRWGELVGAWQGINGFWDGHSVIAGISASEGAYFYRVKAEGYDGVMYDEKGVLQLFR